jgi:hypothetical protein
MGAKLAAPEKFVVATIGDGAYMFANPTVCHWVADKFDIPVLTVIFNNSRYGAVRRATLSMFKDGAAGKDDGQFLADLSPSPPFEQLVRAQGGHGERVGNPRRARARTCSRARRGARRQTGRRQRAHSQLNRSEQPHAHRRVHAFLSAEIFSKTHDSNVPDIGKRVAEVPAIHDVDVRRKVVDSFPDYKQIICVALPPIGTWTPADKAEEVARIANDGLKELCDKYPDQFAGFVAEVPLTAADAGARESERAIKELGACGVQIVTNVNGKPLDRPEFVPVLREDERARRCRCGCIRRAPRRRRTMRPREIALRDLVDLRLVLRHRGLHGAHGVLQDARQVSGPEDHRAPLRRHRADAGRPHRPGLGPARRAHLG